MKKQLCLVLFGVAALSLTGCYTQVAVQEDDDSYVYQEPTPIIIIEPAPPPVVIVRPIIGGPHPLPRPPKEPVEPPPYKLRNPNTRPHTGDIRKPGKNRNPVTPPKRDDFRNPGKIREHVVPPPSNDRIKNDSRNPGGSNNDGRNSRR